MTTRLNTEFVTSAKPQRLDAGAVVKVKDNAPFNEIIKVGQVGVVIGMETGFLLQLAHIAFEVDGFEHVVFQRYDANDYDGVLEYLGEQVESQEFQKEFRAGLESSQVKVVSLDGFDEEIVDLGATYPVVGTEIKPKIVYAPNGEEEGIVDRIDGWEQRFDQTVVIFDVGNGYFQGSSLDGTIEFAKAS